MAKRFFQRIIILSLSLVFFIFGASVSFAGVCEDGIGLPPFLTGSVDPNLLVMIDNSGSMYDLAYIDATKQCSDETYDNTASYGGYFDSTKWYEYDFTVDAVGDAIDQFEELAAQPAFCTAADAETDYFAVDATAAKYVCVDVDLATTPDTVTSFAATGKFLNWVTSSKFDIQKKILTGGKYDDVNDQIQMESRGCLDRRFVKQVTLAQVSGVVSYKLTLGVRGPMETFPNWIDGDDYVTGDIVLSGGLLYKANADDSNSATEPSASASWDEYKETRWYAGHAYPANTAVFDTSSQTWYWTQDGGTSTAGAADISEDVDIDDWVLDNGTSIEIFEIKLNGFDMTACEAAMAAFDTLTGVDDAAETTRLGQLKSDVEDCMGFAPPADKVEKATKSSFNHAMQECWYYDKFGRWQPGGGTVSSMKTSCANVYDFMDSGDITPWDSGYVCYGDYTNATDKSNSGYVGRCWETIGGGGACVNTTCPYTIGSTTISSSTAMTAVGDEDYVCFAGELYKCNTSCNNNNLVADKPQDWDLVQDCPAGGGDLAEDGWTNDDFYFFEPCTYNSCVENDALIGICPDLSDAGEPPAVDYACTDGDGDVWTCQEASGDGDNVTDSCFIADADGDRCVEQAIKDFCGIMNVPEVIDPSDSTSLTGEVWNAPAFLIDGGIMGQMDYPLLTMRGVIEQTTAPEGLIQEFSDDIRMGIMAFNENGAATECAVYAADPTDPISYNCPADNQDGGQIIKEIGATETEIVDGINDIKANAWTPLAEAMYTAIGYYAQKAAWRLNADDFSVATDPVQYWCQDNHILMITEGQSTADQQTTAAAGDPDMIEFVTANNDGSIAEDTIYCPTGVAATDDNLYGSTYFDDLTYFASHASAADFYATTQKGGKNKQEVTTHIVIPGTARTIATTAPFDECSPAILMANAANNGTKIDTDNNQLHESNDIAGLESSLRDVLTNIRAGASAGSAASVISASRGGEGAIYQAIFWQSQTQDDDDKVYWTGEVHALFVASDGKIYEDTNQNRTLDPYDAATNADGDKRVYIYDDTAANLTKACYGTVANGACTGSSADLKDVMYLWSASEWLAKIDNTAAGIGTNRAPYLSDDLNRYIFTWNDLNNDGIVNEYNGTDEIMAFVDKSAGTDWNAIDYDNVVRGPVHQDFGDNTVAEVNKIVKWVRGYDLADMRDRELPMKVDTDGNGIKESGNFKWRLGDVIHSTPMAVTRPSEGFHYLYRDESYAVFAAKYNKRRHVIYYGANDGMMHAVNGGFYNTTIDKFCRTSDCVEEAADLALAPELGAELWAYVPYNLLPHLECMTTNNYNASAHKYYVDLRPRIFDARLWPHDNASTDDHPYGWGTILVGGMRLGGATENASDFNGVGADTRQFKSAYFILDVTNPEAAPTLLGEFTYTGSETSMGYTTVNPTMVIMTVDDDTSATDSCTGDADTDDMDDNCTSWNLVMGTGPTNMVGDSTQIPKMVVLPLAWLGQDNETKRALRIPDAPPSAATHEGGRFILAVDQESPNNGFVSDIITADFLLEKSYMSDVVYAGTMEHRNNGSDYWGGAMYRLVTQEMVDHDSNAATAEIQDETSPHDWCEINGTPTLTLDDVVYTVVDSDADNETPIPYCISIEYDDLGVANTDLSVSVSDYHITVTLATDAVGAITTTTAEIVTAVEASAVAVALLDPSGGSGNLAVATSATGLGGPKPLIDVDQPISAGPSVGTDGDNFWIYFGTGRFWNVSEDKVDLSQQSFYGIKEPQDCDRDFTWATVNYGRTGLDSVGGTALEWNSTPGVQGLQRTDQVLVAQDTLPTATISCMLNTHDWYEAAGGAACDELNIMQGITTFSSLIDSVAGSWEEGCDVEAGETIEDKLTGSDGWQFDFYTDGERNLGQATLLGGLLLYATYLPDTDVCSPEGDSYLYGLHYQTGTSYYQSVFGDEYVSEALNVIPRLDLGRGMTTTPNLQVGKDTAGPKAFIQTSTGEIREIQQETSPIQNYRTGRESWRGTCQ